ncbi:hypothetical protein AYO44_02125 [Planctomycetaceae bacterium SCGC AG-212-F19]|nr:hypothetical protein AYO44_02125 [Planctomycetaceae bacterium SCGC AG-212-F19]
MTGAFTLAVSLVAWFFVFSSFSEVFGWAWAITMLSTGLLGMLFMVVWPTRARLWTYRLLKKEYRRTKDRMARLTRRIAKLQPAEAPPPSPPTPPGPTPKQETLTPKRETLNSKQEVLLQTEWAKLRGLDFALVLIDVLETLGYRVETEGVSPVRGVHCIATRDDRRIAVHARGERRKLDQSVVQQVKAGMGFYECTACVIVTTGRFSADARRVAKVMGCTLVDHTKIDDLVRGRIL